MGSNIKNYSKMFIAMIFWGASFVFIKITYKYVGPVTMIFSRLIIATSLLLVIDKFFFKSKVDKKDFKIFFLLGFTEPFLYFIGEGYGMQYVTSTQASVIVATIPVFAMISSMIFYGEKVHIVNIGGILLSFAGVLIMIGFKNLGSDTTLLGIMLMFLAVFAAVANSIIIFKLGSRYSSFTIITYQNLVGALLFLPMFILLEMGSINYALFKPEFILSLLFLAIFPSVISFLLYISVMKKIGITKTSVFTNLIPIITGIFSLLFLGTKLSVTEAIGIFIVVIGLFISQRKFSSVHTVSIIEY